MNNDSCRIAEKANNGTRGVAPILELRGITKSFGPVLVLDKVDLTLNRGEVLGFVGENGAGKSTLIKIICGIHEKDGGEIFFNGKKTEIRNVTQSQRLGIGAIYQELSIMPDLNAAQNVFLNRELSAVGEGLFVPLNSREMVKTTRRILGEDLHVDIDPTSPARYLTLAQKQMVEIARAIYADKQIIIMDEPTSSLGSAEREQLFKVIRRLKERGHSVIFVSHHLDEVMQVSDRIMVLRDGRKVADETVERFSVDRIIQEMVGKSLQSQYPKEIVPIGEPILSVRGLGRKGSFEDVSFEVREGEILGIVGLEGCGKNEVIRSLFGCVRYHEGEILHRGRKISVRSKREAMNEGIAFVPAERKVEGLFLNRNISWNMTIASLRSFVRFGTLMLGKERDATQRYVSQLGIRARSPRQSVLTLSGGNQQKVMLSRWMMTDPDLFLLEEPTRGIDVNAKTEVYRAIGDCVKRGKGVIVGSSEEEEVLGICDRIIVMFGGRISGVLDAKSVTTATIKSYSLNIGGGSIE